MKPQTFVTFCLKLLQIKQTILDCWHWLQFCSWLGGGMNNGSIGELTCARSLRRTRSGLGSSPLYHRIKVLFLSFSFLPLFILFFFFNIYLYIWSLRLTPGLLLGDVWPGCSPRLPLPKHLSRSRPQTAEEGAAMSNLLPKRFLAGEGGGEKKQKLKNKNVRALRRLRSLRRLGHHLGCTQKCLFFFFNKILASFLGVIIIKRGCYHQYSW